MSIIGSNILAGASGQGVGGYTIENSLRFRSSASAYLSRAQGSATSTTTGTWSGWCKRGKLGAQQFIWSSSNYDFLQFNSDDTIRIAYLNNLGYVSTAAVYRDPSAWYHIVLVFDTTNATAVDRMRLYVNGVQQTLAWGGTSQTQNATFQRWNVSGYTGDIGDFQYNHINFFDGYMAECYWVDGQALNPSSFGEYNADTGVWQPVAYEGTYGNNGFYLPFSDATNTTTLAADSSGNGNDWTPNNISLTSGSTYDSMTDTPTPYADGGNYCVLNPLNTTNGAVAQGNLYWSSGGASGFLCTGTIAFDIADTVNKYYFEIQLAGGDGAIGIAPTTLRGSDTGRAGSYSYYTTGSKYSGVTASAYGAAFAAPNIIGVAVGAGKITFYKNGVSQGDAFNGLTGLFVPMLVEVSGTFNANFGQRPFAYTPPTGFKSLHTGNLPDSTIVSGDDYFKTYLYTGNGGGLQVGEIQKPFTTYEVSNSLRLRSSASAYLSRTLGTPTNANIWTWSGWVKRGTLGGNVSLIGVVAGGTDTNNIVVRLLNDEVSMAGGSTIWRVSSQVFRDPSAWYHIVISVDTTQATANNRILIYVNGVQITAFKTLNNPTQNTPIAINTASAPMQLGAYNTATFFDGYLAEVNFVDGQALTPSDLGDYDGNNYWVPRAYAGTYGTNGFYLDFSDTTSTATLVADQSGVGNDWTPNNISLTAGSTYDSMVDSPTPYADAANYCTLNPLFGRADAGGAYGATNGNLTGANIGAGGWAMLGSTMAIPAASGKYYFECTVGAAPQTMSVGVQKAGTPFAAPYIVGYSGDANGYSYANDGYKFNNGSTAYGSTATVNDVIGVAIDASGATSSIEFYKNGASMGVAFTGISGGLMPALSTTAAAGNCQMNFGQRPFAYTPPTDFKTINSFNIPEVTDDLETPDLVWIKSRSATQSHTLFDNVRGVHNYLQSDNTALETTDVNSLLQFNKNGFLLGASAAVNTSGRTYAGWGWKAGTAFSNDAGTNGATIASVGSVSQDAGFSISTHEAQAGTYSFYHGLGVAPSMFVFKNMDAGSNWVWWQNDIATPPTTKFLYLNLTNGAGASGSNWLQSVTPNVIELTAGQVHGTSGTYVAYAFADVEGYSKFGSYTGNGNPDGVFVYLGFRPKFVMVKRHDSVSSWWMLDGSRDTFNLATKLQRANEPLGEETSYASMDMLSNGFKLRVSASESNASNGKYIYMAFAENPFKNSLAR